MTDVDQQAPETISPATASAAGPAIPTRRVTFEESLRDLPRHFASDGDLILSHLAAALSSVGRGGDHPRLEDDGMP